MCILLAIEFRLLCVRNSKWLLVSEPLRRVPPDNDDASGSRLNCKLASKVFFFFLCLWFDFVTFYNVR